MSAPIRFLAVALAGWVTFRAAASALALPELPVPAPSPSAPPTAAGPAAPAEPITYAPLVAAAPGGAPPMPPGYPQGGYPPGAYPAAYPYPAPPGYGPPPPAYWPVPRAVPVPVRMPVYYPVKYADASMPLPRQTPWQRPAASGADFSDMPASDEAPMARPVPITLPGPGGGPPTAAFSPARGGPPRLDRWSLTSWALLRQDRGVISAGAVTAPALATGGQLGGSQAGARLAYRFNRQFAANLRLSAPIPSAGAASQRFNGEAALGVAWQPFATIPVRLMAERRQRIGDETGGRNAFALLAEGGIYGKPLPLGFVLDGYGQTGIVSARQRDWFVDGALVASRPLFGRYSAGFGVWGGAQRGLNRLDLGPRLSAQLLRGVRANVDYRYRAFGSARPGSGFAVTVTTDF